MKSLRPRCQEYATIGDNVGVSRDFSSVEAR
jgi:hypothetical protein